MIQPTHRKDSADNEGMSEAEFRRIITDKGWNYRSLAERWDFTEGYISKLAKKKDRGRHFDDAVIGLPQLLKD